MSLEQEISELEALRKVKKMALQAKKMAYVAREERAKYEFSSVGEFSGDVKKVTYVSSEDVCERSSWVKKLGDR